jgi:hypothetical protein
MYCLMSLESIHGHELDVSRMAGPLPGEDYYITLAWSIISPL